MTFLFSGVKFWSIKPQITVIRVRNRAIVRRLGGAVGWMLHVSRVKRCKDYGTAEVQSID